MPNDTRDTILIITQEYDSHTDMVVYELNQRGVPVIRMHTSDYPANALTTLEFEADRLAGEIQLPHGRSFRPEQIRSAWYRRPKPVETPDMGPAYNEFARGECNQMLGGLWRVLDCYWVSPPHALRNASHKCYQLQLAANLGLKIPRTLITNDPERIRQFYHSRSKPIVYKLLRGPQGTVKVPDDVPQGHWKDYALPMVYTTLLTDENMEHIDTIRCMPGIFQEYVEKKLELRITIMGKRIFAAEIHSQDSELTKHDWRNHQLEAGVRYGPHQLPSSLEVKLLQMLEHFDLQYGAIDMILTPDDEYVFLEINANGQWQWVESFTGMPMAETFVEMLISGRPAEPA